MADGFNAQNSSQPNLVHKQMENPEIWLKNPIISNNSFFGNVSINYPNAFPTTERLPD